MAVGYRHSLVTASITLLFVLACVSLAQAQKKPELKSGPETIIKDDSVRSADVPKTAASKTGPYLTAKAVWYAPSGSYIYDTSGGTWAYGFTRIIVRIYYIRGGFRRFQDVYWDAPDGAVWAQVKWSWYSHKSVKFTGYYYY